VWEQIYRLERARPDLEAAVNALQAWRSTDPDNARVVYLLGLHLSAARPEDALPLLLEAAQRDSHYNGQVQVLRRGLAQASVASDPGYAWLMIGRALGRLNEWELALVVFEKAAAASPAYAEAWAFVGEARYQLGLPAREALEKARTLDPQSTLVRALSALHWRRSGQPDLAFEALQQVARQEPDEPIWQIELGNTLIESGNLIGARPYFDRALRLAPQSLPTMKAVIAFSVQYNVEVRDLGLATARDLVLLAPEDAEALDLTGQVFMRLEDNASAERFLQRALQQQPDFAPAYLHLGQLYLQMGESARALPYLRRAVDLAKEGMVRSIARRLLLRYFNEGG
jgi:tetratricopeptide (TPR) repeat protein